MHVVKLEAENIKRLKAVSITPDGALVRINGNNGQGKTSVLDAITYALGGKETHPPAVIRKGETHAAVVVDLGDIIVERKWTANDKSTVEVRSKDGAKFDSPQKMLDKLVGSLSFDPLSFMRLEPRKQAETLRKLVGLDFTALEMKRAAIFEARTGINGEGKAMKARLDAMPQHADAPDAPIDVNALLEQQKAHAEAAARNRGLRQRAATLERDLTAARQLESAAQTAVEAAEQALNAARAKHITAVSAAVEASAKSAEAKHAADAAVDPDDAAITEAIRNAQRTNEAVRGKAERARAAENVEAKRAESQALTEQINAIDADKAAQLASATFPVPGLLFTDSGVTLNELPLQQASAAEQLRVSLAMGIALNPKLKVLLIRDGSLLDEESLAIVGKMAETAGAQVWIEMVGAGGTGVLIEDGEVKAVRSKTKPGETGTML